MNFGNIVIMMSKFGSKSGDFAQRATNPYYPGGESLGYKEFYNVYNETGNDIQATKATTFYKTMSSKGFLTIKVDIYPEKEEVIVILKK